MYNTATVVQGHPATTADFTVSIIACGTIPTGMVYAVGVTQPVQSWTVLRSHQDFESVSQTLQQQFLSYGLPSCPRLSGNTSSGSNNGDTNSVVVTARNEVQNWLFEVLQYPGVAESSVVRQFLTLSANTIPQQYENVEWTQFISSNNVSDSVPNNPNSPVVSPPTVSEANSNNSNENHYSRNNDSNSSVPSLSARGNVADMEMADMFFAGDDENDLDDLDDGVEEEYIPSASVRYKPTDEAVTDEDELDMMTGEVEMIEDIGSLAQSLGASHLGRSLQLQREMNHYADQGAHQISQGLNVGGALQHQHSALTNTNSTNNSSLAVGGLAGAIAANNTTGTENFYQRTASAPPRLDSFKMIKVIGKGSFGKVFLVKLINTGEVFALKVLRKDNIITRNQVEHTKTERNVLGYVKHPFIVGMNMAFQSRDKLYFVLDYCAGGELFFHLTKLGKFPEPRARFYAAEIASAISYVHSLDIIYRDLKPENVLLTAQGHIRLTDFGLSKEGINSSSSGANSYCGTPEYLAPEILNRHGHGRAVDWWSLGALLYEMLTGLPPFYCQNRDRLFEKIKRSELHYPASLSRQSRSILRGLLLKDPTRRLGSGPTGDEEIKSHDFFAEIDWVKLVRGEIPPPWRPTIVSSTDTSQFDNEFTNMPVFSPHSMQRGFGATPAENLFEGFTFTNRGVIHGPGA